MQKPLRQMSPATCGRLSPYLALYAVRLAHQRRTTLNKGFISFAFRFAQTAIEAHTTGCTVSDTCGK